MSGVAEDAGWQVARARVQRVEAGSKDREVLVTTAAEKAAAIEATGHVTAAWITRQPDPPTAPEVEEYIQRFKRALLL